MAYKKTRDLTRSFHIEMPVELIPIHQELQRVYNLILSNEATRYALLNEIDYNTGAGNVWIQMGRILNGFVYEELQGKISNKAWFARMLYENLRRTVESLREKIAIFEVLKDGKFKIDEKLLKNLRSKGLYTTRGGLENLKDAGKPPELPRSANFVMDYAVYNRDMFLKDITDNTKMRFKYNKKDWVDLGMVLPLSLRLEMTGKLGQPSFYLKNGKYVGDIRYYVKPHEQKEGKNVLGVDYGRKYVYSAAVLYEDGSTSQQYLPSRRLQHLNFKKEKLITEIKRIRDKIERAEPYLASDGVFNTTVKKQENRLQNDLDNRQRVINLKNEEAALSAVELVEIAIQNDCSEIHVDNLKWLKSRGGKWNFSACQEKLVSIAELFGIKVVVVNTANSSKTHPITEEVGRESGRDVVYSDGERLDRDFVASINHAKRNSPKNKRNSPSERKVKKINKRSPKKVGRISNRAVKRQMREILDQKRDTEIVVFSPVKPGASHEHCLETGFKAKHSLAKGHVFEKLALPRVNLRGVTKCH